MDTNRIKKFAIEARNILKRGIAAKITSLGFNAKGEVDERFKPQLMQGGSLWNGQLQTEGFYHQWMALYRRMQEKNLKEVYEEAAYTWFNRLMAIRILQKNGFCEPVMEYADAARTPRIVNEARMGNIPQMPEAQRLHLMELLDDDTKVTDQFALLMTAWCHQNPIIQACFGGIADYTELLLPQNILAEGGLVDMINHTEFITDEEYQSPELIGWLYQFYISERKDEVFAKKGKFEADEIPAATQIFTPNWIVKYMVQNTVGRIYLDNNPWTADEWKGKWKYLVEPSEPTPADAVYHYNELTDLKVADLACGSGHILNECFDLLYDLYISEGYSRHEAITNIFTHNLIGIDLDTRAKQLAQFALLLKACQKDDSFADAHCMPHVKDIPFVSGMHKNDEITLSADSIAASIGVKPDNPAISEIITAFKTMQDADSLGSIMKFNISSQTRTLIKSGCESLDQMNNVYFYEQIRQAFHIILALTEQYSAIVMNPPYMGSGNMNTTLSKYVKDNYEEGKADLFSTFMMLAINRLAKNGKYGMINMHSWMFLSSFEKLRTSLLKNYHIENLLHLGPRTFDELSGEVVQNAAFVIGKTSPANGTYYRLVDGKDCANKERMFIAGEGYYPNISQQNFRKIPGCPLGYWVSDKVLNAFKPENLISSKSIARSGFSTGNNDRYIRFWAEVDFNQIGFGLNSNADFIRNDYRYVPFTKGGSFRRWYGNLESIVDWKEPDTMHRPRTTYMNLYYKPAITWNAICSGKLSCRYYGKGFLFEHAAASLFVNHGYNNKVFLAYLNTPVFQSILSILNPTLNTGAEVVSSIPIIIPDYDINTMVDENISISKSDWDAHETSWDFEQNELVSLNNENAYIEVMNEWADFNGVMVDLEAPKVGDLEWLMSIYQTKWETMFKQLHLNEEELNRQFIEIYGLQDDLTPDVPLNEITILQQGEIDLIPASGDTSGCCETIKWNADVVLKQLISYAVGIWMGRYRLDKKGLHIAHPEPTSEELTAYDYNDQTVYIDDDGIIPILPSAAPFDDNLCHRIADFMRIAFGEENLTRNMNYIEQQLGMSIEQYCTKDFWKDHKKMYQNRPIYWLFSSKKGAFKCITYMHRMDAYTAERVRSKYLLPYIEWLQNKVNDLDSRAAQLSTSERRQFDNLRKTLEESQEYHDRLQVLAEDTARTGFDLDDGVVVNYAKYGDVLAKIK